MKVWDLIRAEIKNELEMEKFLIPLKKESVDSFVSDEKKEDQNVDVKLNWTKEELNKWVKS